MACYAEASESPCPPLCPSLKRASEAIGQGSRPGDRAWAQQPGLPLSVNDEARTTAACPACQQQEVTLRHQYGSISQVNEPATWWQLDHVCYFYDRRRSSLFFLEQTHAGDGFPFTANNDPARNTIHDFGDCFLHSQEILHGIPFKQGNNLLQMKSDSWPMHVVLMVPFMHFIPTSPSTHPQLSGSWGEWGNRLLKTHLKHLASTSGYVLQAEVSFWSWYTILCFSSSHS